MANARAVFACILLLLAMFTLIAPAVAQPATEPNTGKIICISPNNPNICQLRVTYYWGGQTWPMYHQADYPYNGGIYSDGRYQIWIDVYDGFCNFLGMAVGSEWGHVSVTSRLPWTAEVNLPRGFPNMFELNGMYGGQGVWPSTNQVNWLYDSTLPWGIMVTALFGFPC